MEHTEKYEVTRAGNSFYLYHRKGEAPRIQEAVGYLADQFVEPKERLSVHEVGVRVGVDLYRTTFRLH